MKNILFLLIISSALLSQSVRTDHVTAELVSEFNTIKPGVPFTVALRLEMDEHWHTYWRNAGDSGIPTTIEWNLPPGFEAGNIHWQFPQKIVVEGLSNFAYEEEVFLLVNITPPDIISASEITLNAKADWLVCKIECLPGGADLSLTLPVSDRINEASKWFDDINRTRSLLPIANAPWTVSAEVEEESVTLFLTSEKNEVAYPGDITFFPYTGGIFDNASQQEVSRNENTIRIKLPLEAFRSSEPDTIRGILVSDTGWRGDDSEKAFEISIIPGEQAPISENQNSESLLLILGFAFIGGLILNLMPCVLPVLSLKIMGFVEQANSGKREIYHHGLSFTAGVLVSFWVLAGVLLLLQSGGQKLGWGFQLQEPIFLLVLIILLFLFSLNLFGVFEIGSSLTRLGGGSSKSSGLTGSFISGVTATIVATPCTAPFMGSALGYTLTQPALITMTVFTALALGMASPYLLLSIFPKWLKIIPKPGNWMIAFKQFMGFLLAATIIWLLWVLSAIKGSDGLLLTLMLLLFSSIAAWIYGTWGNISVSTTKRRIATVISLVILLLPGYYLGSTIEQIDFSQSSTSENSSDWENYSNEKVQQYLSEGIPVFIDFTATWCLTCQVNKKVALHNDEVESAFKDAGIKTIIADWTKRDDEITDALASFGRNSVPLYVLYSGKKGEKPVILPEVLTPEIVIDYINQL
ncbi:MAG: thiol:disulfide interchange protein [Melioribacteraceae bacterium]|nr:MAG: thiol:disulfide interchange protein [Melioribacteraceae bacterium]